MIERFDAEAAYWQAMFGLGDVLSVIHQRRLHLALRLVDRAALPEGSSVLEIGAGAGILAAELARRGYEVKATDPAPRMRALIVASAAAAGVTSRVHVSAEDATRLSAPPASVDLVVALGVLPWLADPTAAVAEMARVVRRGGAVLLSTVSRSPLPVLLDPLRHPSLGSLRDGLRAGLAALRGRSFRPPDRPPSWLTPDEADRLLCSVGLELVEGVPFGYGPLTWLGRPAFDDRLGTRLEAELQERLAVHQRLARRIAAQYVVLATRPAAADGQAAAAQAGADHAAAAQAGADHAADQAAVHAAVHAGAGQVGGRALSLPEAAATPR
ncbi:MAG TPA: class I SAM-dependent methyltransferase [Candidatus Limnocylindrales bacterium]